VATLSLEVAAPSDVDDLLDLRNDAARWLLDRGIEQWRPGEFTADRMRSWVEQGYLHVLRDRGRLAASVAILWDDPDIWGDADKPAGYVHLLVVRRDRRGTGLGDAVLLWAERHIRGSGRRFSRLDAVSSNRTLHDWYERRGYSEVGRHSFEDGSWFPVTLREKPLGT
jgi:GNAT superfamily N-acetyltransferase